MTAHDAHGAAHGQSGVPLIFRVAAQGRRLLPRAGVDAVRRSPAAHPLRRMLARSAPAGPQRIEVCGGRMKGTALFVDLSCEKYYWLGTHEERVQDALAEHVSPGLTVYDVGAHAGFFTLLASRLAGPSGRVFAFEPRPDNVERLHRNIDANRVTNVDVIPAALSDRSGSAAFVMHESTLEGRLADPGEMSAASVRTEAIDALVRDGMAPPDLMKVDVEGAEGGVIRGAARTIDAHRPVMLIEVHSIEAGREVAFAMPCAYTFEDIETRIEAGAPGAPAHYLARPVVGPGRAF
jgi:FkbM family methyltransferase